MICKVATIVINHVTPFNVFLFSFLKFVVGGSLPLYKF